MCTFVAGTENILIEIIEFGASETYGGGTILVSAFLSKPAFQGVNVCLPHDTFDLRVTNRLVLPPAGHRD